MDVLENNLENRINKLGDDLIVEKGKKGGHIHISRLDTWGTRGVIS